MQDNPSAAAAAPQHAAPEPEGADAAHAEPSAAEPGPADSPAPTSEAPEAKRPGPLFVASSVALVLGVLAILVLGVLHNRTPTTTADTSPAVAGRSSDSGGGLAVVARDDFARPDSTSAMGVATTGQDWSSALGTWGLIGGAAYVSTPNSTGPRSLAVIDPGSADGGVKATATKLGRGWSLVFRYAGPTNYWVITADTERKSWRVQHLVTGKTSQPVTITDAPMKDGTVVGVTYVGTKIEVWIDGRSVKTITEQVPNGGTMVGFGLSGSDTTCRWGAFSAQGAGTSTSTSAPKSTTTAKSTNTTKAATAKTTVTTKA